MTARSQRSLHVIVLSFLFLILVSVSTASADADVAVEVDGSAEIIGLGEPISQARTLDQILRADDYVEADAHVLRLYQAFFNRTPDVGGAKFWLAERRRDVSLDAMAYAFADSQEFRSTYGPTDDRVFVTIVYRNVLGREPDADGLSYWVGLVESDKLSRHGAVRWIAANDEFVVAHPFAELPPIVLPPVVDDPPTLPTLPTFPAGCTFAPTPLRLEPLAWYHATIEGSTKMVATVTGHSLGGTDCSIAMSNAEISVAGLGPNPIVLEARVSPNSGQFSTARLSVGFEVPLAYLDDDGAFQPTVTVTLANRTPITMTALLRVSDRIRVNGLLFPGSVVYEDGPAEWPIEIESQYSFPARTVTVVARGKPEPGALGCVVAGVADADGWVRFTGLTSPQRFSIPLIITTGQGQCNIEYGLDGTPPIVSENVLFSAPISEEPVLAGHEYCDMPACRLHGYVFPPYSAGIDGRTGAIEMIVTTLEGNRITSDRITEFTEGERVRLAIDRARPEGFCTYFRFELDEAPRSSSTEPRCFEAAGDGRLIERFD